MNSAKKISVGLLLVAALNGLAACGPKLKPYVKADPPNEDCDILCRTPCTVDKNIRLVPKAGDKDVLETITRQVIIPLRGEVRVCDTHRVACVQCLDRLQDAGVTKKEK